MQNITQKLKDRFAKSSESDNRSAERQAWLDALRYFYNNAMRYDMRAKARKIEHLLVDIFDIEDMHPEQEYPTEKLERLYMPIIIKSLNRLIEMEKTNVVGENKEEMVKSITELLNDSTTALAEMRDKMYSNDVFDTTADIKVLRTIMRQDGLLTEDEMIAVNRELTSNQQHTND